MRSTIHISQIDKPLMQRLQLLANKEHTSIEDIVRRYLTALTETDIDIPSKENKDQLIAKLFGTWSNEEVSRFEQVTAPFDEIDPSLWQ